MRFKEYLIIESTIAHAAVWAAEKHIGQFRKGSGAPYIVHPKSVFKLLKSVGVKDKTLLLASWLHDVIEDTKTTYNDIKNEFSKEVADIVKQLTSDSKEISKVGKPKYLFDKMVKMSDGGLSVKLADRLHNVSDMTTTNKKFADKTWDQTWYIIDNLRKKRKLNSIHKKLIRMIIKQLNLYKEK